MVEPAPGILLIADPFLKDPNFLRTVVFLCDHREEGSFGFILNRKFDYTLDELIEGMEGLKVPVYYGGPVQPDTIHFLHQYPDDIPDSLQVTPDIYWGGNFETVLALLRAGTLDERKIRFYIGYSGWSTGQLNDEMKEKTWLTVKANRRLVFHHDHTAIWKDSLTLLGDEYKIMINFPIDPQLN